MAEDQVMFRESLATFLQAVPNFTVLFHAENGKKLIDLLHQSNETPDVVLLDLTMPEMNGLQTTEYLREHFPDIKILILSVHSEQRHIAHMIGVGVNAYLVKNTELDTLKAAIEAIYHKGFYFTEEALLALHSGMAQKKSRNFQIENNLTAREKEVLALICQELTTSEIAQKLFLSARTVEGHRNSLLEKTGARNTAGLVLFAIKHGHTEMEI